MTYDPEIGDIVGVNLDPACPGEFKYHGIRPLVNFLLGNVEAVEVPHVDDHLCAVRFLGPIEGRAIPGLGDSQGFRMYFKHSELILVCASALCNHERLVMLSIDSRNYSQVLSTSCRTIEQSGHRVEPRIWCENCWDRVEGHDDDGWGHKANEVLL